MTERLDPEKVAYWCLRLNGFLQIENFVLHPSGRGSQRTDADLLAVRFPHRAEFFFDSRKPMQDDVEGLALSDELIDVVIAEAKRNQPCSLNGPWTRKERQNVHRVLAALGCIRTECIDAAADDIYSSGTHHSTSGLRIRLVAIGREHNQQLAAVYPAVTQVIWSAALCFIWQRFDAYSRQKADVPQWDQQGLRLKRLAHEWADPTGFVSEALSRMRIRA